jgi:anti-sigma B factor antagonist
MDHDETPLSELRDGNGAAYRIAPSGELDIDTIDPVRDRVDAAIGQGATSIVFDLADVTFLDSSALAVFAYAARRVATVQIANPSAIARRVIEESGLVDVLRVAP